MNVTRRSISATFAVSIATPSLAQPALVADSGDSGWVLLCGLLVLVTALPGAALLYTRNRAAAATGVLPLVMALATLIFVAIGYSLAFGEGTAWLGGAGNAFLGDLLPLREGATVSEGVFAFFELGVCLTSIAILVSSLADRARAGWLIPFAGLWTLIVYVPVARWLWSGWLIDLGASDFGGGVVVQATAGLASLVIALMLRAQGRGELSAESRLPLAGAALLSVALLAVLGGKIYGAGDDAASVLFNALSAAAAAALAGAALQRWRDGHATGLGAAASALAGVAAVSAGADAIGVGGAMVLGIGGAAVMHAATWLLGRTGAGAAASAFAVQAAPALSGAILFPLFVPTLGGAGFADGASLVTSLAAQAVAVAAVALWTIVATTIAALMVSMVVPMRQDPAAA